MNTNRIARISLVYAALVGLMDFTTGLGLLAAPALTLTLMGVAVPSLDALPYVRFVGVFVGAVGATYLWAAAGGHGARLRATFASTLFFRGGAGMFVAVAVIRGVFEPAWIVVAATDLSCVAVQLWLLAKGVGREN